MRFVEEKIAGYYRRFLNLNSLSVHTSDFKVELKEPS